MAISPSDKAALLDLWRRVLPPSYTAPIEDEANGQGFDVPSGQAAIHAAASNAVVRTWQSLFLRPYPTQLFPPSSGAARAVVVVEVRRTTSTAGDLRLLPGTPLYAQQEGTAGQAVELPLFELAEELLLPEGDPGPLTVEAQAVFVGTTGNVRVGTITRFGRLGRVSVPCVVQSVDRLVRAPGTPDADRFAAAMAGRFVTLVGLPGGPTVPRRIVSVTGTTEIVVDPVLQAGDVGSVVTVEVVELEDLGLAVTNPAAATGGLFGTLDAIARDRHTGRVPGESDDQLRERIAALLDVVSPGAMLRVCDRVLTPCGIRFELRETRDAQKLRGFVWDLDALDFGSVEPVVHVVGSQLIGQGAVLLDEIDATSMFIVAVSYGNEGEFGFAYDQPAAAVSPAAAWDWAAWDGRPAGYLSCLGQVYAAVEQARAAGVNWQFWRDSTL